MDCGKKTDLYIHVSLSAYDQPFRVPTVWYGFLQVATPLTKFALSITPVALAVEELLPSTHRSPTMSILIRTALLFSSLVVALTVPYFGKPSSKFNLSSLTFRECD